MRSRGRLSRAVAGLVFAAGLSLAPVAVGGVAFASAGAHPAQADAAPKVDDPASTRKAYLVMIGLVAVGVGLVGFTLRYWRSTRPEPEALSRLETMSSKRWEKSDYMDRLTRLDDARPFDGTDGPMIWDAPDEPVPALAGTGDSSATDESLDTSGIPPATSAGASLTLAEMARAVPPATAAEPIGDPEVLKALGLDDESLGLAPSPLPDYEEAPRRWWSRSRREPVAMVDDSGPIVSAPAADGAEPVMATLFDASDGIPAPAVWHPSDEVSEEELHVREATGEFSRLLEASAHHDEPEPEQQRFALPGEPLL